MSKEVSKIDMTKLTIGLHYFRDIETGQYIPTFSYIEILEQKNDELEKRIKELERKIENLSYNHKNKQQ